MDNEEREKYDIDDVTYLMPDYFSNNEDRFHLFRYERNVKSNITEWEKLIEIEEYYKNNKFSYKIQENKGRIYYTEYINDTEIENIVFGELEYGSILNILEEKVSSFTEAYSAMRKIYPKISERRVQEVLSHLKEAYLVYFNSEFSNIVSIIGLNA